MQKKTLHFMILWRRKTPVSCRGLLAIYEYFFVKSIVFQKIADPKLFRYMIAASLIYYIGVLKRNQNRQYVWHAENSFVMVAAFHLRIVDIVLL